MKIINEQDQSEMIEWDIINGINPKYLSNSTFYFFYLFYLLISMFNNILFSLHSYPENYHRL